MKWLPTVLVIVAFLVLLKVSQMQPKQEVEPQDSSAAATSGHAENTDPAGHGAGGGAPHAGGDSTSPAAQGDPGAGAAASSPRTTVQPGTIHGVVQSGNANIPGVEVSLYDANGDVVSTTRSDDGGRYRFTGSAAGQYKVAATDPSLLYSHSSSPKVQLTAGGTGEANITMTRGNGSLVGHVRDSLVDGVSKPLVGKVVAVRSLDIPDFELTVLTDPRGNYRVGGLPDGRYEVSLPAYQRWTTVKVEGKEPATAPFDVVLPSSLTVTLGESYLYSPGFTGKETITLTPTDQTIDHYAKATAGDATEGEAPDKQALAATLRQTVAVSEEGAARFGEVFPGTWVVAAGFPDRDLSIGRPGQGPVTLTLDEGSHYEQVLPLSGAIRGSGVHVPLGFKVFLWIFFGLLFTVPAILFPPPLQPKGPARA